MAYYYACGVVVHSWLLQRLINHEWGTSLTDVGLGVKPISAKVPEVKIPNTTLEDEKQNLTGLAP